MLAIAGAAAILKRDAEELARLMSDGRLAYYIRDGERSIPMPLDDPEPTHSDLEAILTSSAARLRRAHEMLLKQVDGVSRSLELAERDLLERAGRVRDARR